MKKTKVINLFGGPGTGKSTVCAQIFSELKWKGVDCEMVREYAKEKVWEGSLTVLEDQIYIFGKQLHKMKICSDKVDIIITDSPILFSILYSNNESENFTKLVLEEHNKFDNLNIFLQREKNYNPNGRLQTEDSAKELDTKIKQMLSQYKIPYYIVKANKESALEILNM